MPLLRSLGAEEGLVLFSGGKDSWVVLDLCRRVLKRVEAVHWHIVPDMEVEEVQLRQAEALGVRVHRLPHPDVTSYLQDGGYRPHVAGFDWRQPKLSELIDAVRLRTGLEWALSGERMSDSLGRRRLLSVVGGAHAASRRAYPIWNWSTSLVLRYGRERRLPRSPVIGGQRSGGVDFRPTTLAYLRDRWPQDYARLLRVYPWAEASLVRAAAQERARAEAKAAGT